MLFSSTIFLFMFLPVVLGLYCLAGLGHKTLRNVVLLVASLFFYAWGEKAYVLILLLSIVGNHMAGALIHRAAAANGKRARLVLVGAVVLNLGLLGFFKYYDFIFESLYGLLGGILSLDGEASPGVHLPIGISFFTFQALSYVVDVYRGKTEPQGSLLNTALYIALFPQLIAGPIIRYRDVAAQLVERTTGADDFAYGIERFVIGLGKKVIVANTMAGFADYAFSSPAHFLTTPVAWMGVLAYTFQIYFDFSGYSDMAIGLGRMFGFRFLENFEYPYISRSIREFWRRWHISLSNWFRDYLYIPLGGNRKGSGRTHLNLIVVFFLCGLWHGAGWTFILWGLFHGLFLALERTAFGRFLARIPTAVQRLYTLLVVLVGWVLFRAESLEKTGLFFKRMAGIEEGAETGAHFFERFNGEFMLVLGLAFLFAVPILPWIRQRADRVVIAHPLKGVASKLVAVLGFICLAGVLILSAAKLAAGTYNPFIYFRF